MYNLYVDAVVVLARYTYKIVCNDCWKTPKAGKWTKVLRYISLQFAFSIPLELNSVVSEGICRLWGNAVLPSRSVSIFWTIITPPFLIYNSLRMEKIVFSETSVYFFGFIILQATSPRLDGRTLQEARLFWNLSIFLYLLYRSLKKIRHRFMCGVESGWRRS